MANLLEWITIAAHVLLYPICALNIWIFHQRSEYYTSVVRLRSLPLIYFGFACFAIATSYSIAEHISESWLYANRLSSLNQIFFASAVAGVGLIAMGLKKSKISDPLILASIVLLPFVYGFQGEKTAMGFVQAVPTLFFVSHWYQTMKDWRIFIYPALVLGGIINLVVWLDKGGPAALYPLSWLLRDIAIASLGYVAWVNPLHKRQS